MNYSEETLLKVFSRKTISAAKAKEIARKPKEIEKFIIGKRFGRKDRLTKDEWKYRASGFIQIAGKANYRKLGIAANIPLEEQPDLARRPKEALLIATAYWTSRDINRTADQDALYRIRVLINGRAAHGYKQSQVWYRKAKKIFMPKKNTFVDKSKLPLKDQPASLPAEKTAIEDTDLTAGEIDQTLFFRCAQSLHPRVTKQQVDSYTAIFNVWLKSGYKDLRWLAYSLGTAYHETDGKMIPVREGFAKTDMAARKLVTKMWNKRDITLPYHLADRETGQVYYGRGFFQLTGVQNYKKISQKLGMGDQLYQQPDLALNPETAASILINGLVNGWIRANQKLGDYFNGERADWVSARKVLNGDNKGPRVAAHARKYNRCLKWVREPKQLAGSK